MTLLTETSMHHSGMAVTGFTIQGNEHGHTDQQPDSQIEVRFLGWIEVSWSGAGKAGFL